MKKRKNQATFKQARKRHSKNTRDNNQLNAWLAQHFRTFKQSLARMWVSPVATWITLAAIAIALSLPTGLYLLLDNLQSLTDDKREIPTLSLFMKKEVSVELLHDRAQVIEDLPSVQRVHIVSREQALTNMRKLTGFAETLPALDENPFPHVLVVVPHIEVMDRNGMKELERQLLSFPEIDILQMDIEWVQRLHAIMNIAERVVLVVAILLSLTVLLVVGNTIRLDIENRREEIEIVKLIGGSNHFIRRPFLYEGFWYGLFGGLLSMLIVQIAVISLIEPVSHLAELYGGDYSIHGMNIMLTLKVLLLSILLGLGGAWLAVGRHLRRIELTN